MGSTPSYDRAILVFVAAAARLRTIVMRESRVVCRIGIVVRVAEYDWLWNE